MPEPRDTWADTMYAALGRLVSEARIKRGITQESLAQRVGLTRSSITNLEAGRQRIQVHVLFEIALSLDMAPELLLPAVDTRVEDLLDGLDERLEGQPESTRLFVLNALRSLPGGEKFA